MSERSSGMEGAVDYKDILGFLDASLNTEARLGWRLRLHRRTRHGCSPSMSRRMFSLSDAGV